MDDLGHELVEVVKLVHEEGVLLVRVGGDVLQLVLGRPGDADGVGDHTLITDKGGSGLNTHTHTPSHGFGTSNTHCLTPGCELTRSRINK